MHYTVCVPWFSAKRGFHLEQGLEKVCLTVASAYAPEVKWGQLKARLLERTADGSEVIPDD